MRAAIYVRVSTKGQEDDGTSLQTQEAACLRFAAERGYSVAPEHVYREVFTGVELWDRPQLTALRDAVRRHEIDAVVAYAIDRLSRDPVHLGVVLSEADHKGVAVQFVTEPLDDSPEGQLIRFVRGYAAKVEHEKIKERSIRGRKARATAGKLIPSGRVLYGYQWRSDEHDQYIPNPATAPIVERIYDRALSGASLRQIARELDDLGVPTPTGVPKWRRTTVHRILTEPLYTGDARAWRGEIELPAGTVAPLVDREHWAAVQERLRLNQERLAGRPAKDPEAALLRRGLARCGVCQRAMSVAISNGGLSYICTARGECPSAPSIRVSKLDAALWDHAQAILTRDDVIAEAVETLRTSDPTTSDLQAIDRRVAEATRQRDNYVTSIGATHDPDTIAVLTQSVERLSGMLRQLADERDKVLERRRAWEAAQQRLDDLVLWRQRVAENARTLDYAGRRLALEMLGLTAHVYPANATPRFVVELRKPFDELFLNCPQQRDDLALV
ncbi:MAG: hypothetical protein DCC58_14825 [Chloroflexi bacterium]|nr:MAG: hypothetical protein DCC58_14825 [Chloroflexota bacterium]